MILFRAEAILASSTPKRTARVSSRNIAVTNKSNSLTYTVASCVGEVIVQGDEGPVVGVAQGVHCHGVTVSHEEKVEAKVEQEVESDGEKNTQGTLRMSMDEMTMEDKCERLEPCGM